MITVTPILASKIELNQHNLNAYVGDEIQLTATVTPSNAANKNVEWISTDATKATVSTTGLVNILTEGTVKIVAKTTDGTNLSDTCVITSTVDGIAEIMFDGETEYSVYSLNGSLIANGVKSISELPRGIYVIRGRKVKVK